MRIAILTCCILALVFLALASLSYVAGIPSEVSVTGIDNGVIIQNVGNTRCVDDLCFSIWLGYCPGGFGGIGEVGEGTREVGENQI